MALFQEAVGKTLAHEGGFQCSAHDSGNWTGGAVGCGELVGTNFGISARQFPGLDIKNLTQDQASQIYEKEYWLPVYDQINSQPLADKLFDLGVLFGPGAVIRFLQLALGIQPDGQFGPATLEAVNSADPGSLLQAFKTTAATHAINQGVADPNKKMFVAGWIRRINS